MKKAMRMMKENMWYVIGIVLINIVLALVVQTVIWSVDSFKIISEDAPRNVVLRSLALSLVTGGLILFFELLGKNRSKSAIVALLSKNMFYVSATWGILVVVSAPIVAVLIDASHQDAILRVTLPIWLSIIW